MKLLFSCVSYFTEKNNLVKVLVDYSKALLPFNEASKFIYCAKNYIRIRELYVFHFFLFLSMLVHVCPFFSIFIHIVLTFLKKYGIGQIWTNMDKNNRDVPHITTMLGSPWHVKNTRCM